MVTSSIQKIALFPGRGQLPHQIIECCHQSNIPYIIMAIDGQTPDDLPGEKHPIRLGAIGEILKILSAEKISHIMLAGTLTRPSWNELGLDWVGTRWIAKMGLKSLGDDGLLSAAASLLEAEGYQILAPHELLDNLLMPRGILSNAQPTDEDWQDIQYGTKILEQLSALDIGQSVVVQQGIVLAIEAIEGTDLMIERAGQHKRNGPCGVLVKRLKTTQNQKLDLPTIGPKTIRNLHKAGLKGIAVSAQTAQVIDQEKTIQLANELGVFIVGID